MNVQRLTLDLDKSSVPRGRVTIAQCDHDGTTVEAEIYDNGVALNTSGLSAYLVMRLPDGRHYYRVPATLDGHVATALMDEAYAATVAGTTEIAYFELVGSGGVVYSTSRFGVRVLPSATAGATVPETWDGEVERLIQQLDEMAESSRVIIDDLTTLEETVGAAEQGRVSAERGRVTAEQGRVSEFATLKSQSQAATSTANTAANNANQAAGTVQDVVGRAEGATVAANASATNADAAAQEAREAAAAAVAVTSVYYTTEAVGDHQQLTMVYELVTEE